MGTFNIEPLFAIMKHKIQIYNKNVYLLHVIAYARGFNFIKGNPYKNYTDKNHFVSKRIQNRKKYVFKLNMYTFVHIIKVLFPGKDTQALINVIVYENNVKSSILKTNSTKNLNLSRRDNFWPSI